MAATPPIEVLIRKKKIYQITNPRLVQAPSSTTIARAVEIMQEHKAGYIVIADGGTLAGIFTEADVVQKLLGTDVDWSRPVSDVMTKDPAVLRPSDSVGKAIELMGRERLYHIPLVGDNKALENVLSVRSLIRFLAEFYPDEVYNLPPDPNQIMPSQEGG
ncbi:MAG TPA: CBS domain-containing protein [bacterium]